MREPERGSLDRRTALRLGAAAGAAATLGGCGGAPAAAVATHGIPVGALGLIAANEARYRARWRRWLGKAEDHDLIYFDQRSWPQLDASVDFAIGLGRGAIAEGRRVHWSVPVGGKAGYDAVAAGAKDDLYRKIARGIAAATPAAHGRICIRLPWEFNLEGQTLAARNAKGVWAPRAYVAAARRIVQLFRLTSLRFYFDWCPAILANGIEPDRCYPGDDVVDVVSVDLYYQAKYADQGRNDGGEAAFWFYKSQPYGLDWLIDFGKRHGKLIGLSEWGVDSDRATKFMQLMVDWIGSAGPLLAHHNWWDRSDGGINTTLSDGHMPAIGAIYRRAFGTG